MVQSGFLTDVNILFDVDDFLTCNQILGPQFVSYHGTSPTTFIRVLIILKIIIPCLPKYSRVLKLRVRDKIYELFRQSIQTYSFR